MMAELIKFLFSDIANNIKQSNY